LLLSDVFGINYSRIYLKNVVTLLFLVTFPDFYCEPMVI
jgi:hypothetical protein